MAIKVYEESSNSIVTPALGARIFFENNTLKYKKSNGTVEMLSTGLTLEEAQDLLANSFQDSSSITWVYDDPNNVFVASLEASLLSKLNGLHAVASSGDYNDLINTPSSNVSAYLDRFFDINNNPQVSTSSSFVDRFNVNYNLAFAASYKVCVDFFYSYDSTSRDIIVELLVNGAVVREMRAEPKDSSGSGNGGTNQRHSGAMSYIFTAIPGSNNFNLRFRSEQNGTTAAIKDHTLTVERFI